MSRALPIRLSLVVLSSLSLSGCFLWNNNSDTPPNAEKGRIAIPDADAAPRGLSVGSAGTLVVTGKGKQADNKGKIFSTDGSEKFVERQVAGAAANNYNQLTGSVFDPNSRTLYACSNTTTAGTAPQVAAFALQQDGSYTWRASYAFPDATAYCYSLALVQGKLYATSSRATAGTLADGAIYSLDLTAQAVPANLTKALTYQNLGYQAGDIVANTDLVTDITPNLTQTAGQASFYVVDAKRTKLLSVTMTAAAAADVTTVAADDVLDGPMSVVQAAPDDFFIALNPPLAGPGLYELYRAAPGDTKLSLKFISSMPSEVPALVYGPAYYSPKGADSLFALGGAADGDGNYFVYEFSVSPALKK